MNRVELITIQETFWIERRQMLIIWPDFSIPKGEWKEWTENVMILTPDGRNIEAKARFTIWHLNYRDPHVSVNKRWRVFLHLMDAKKDDIPVGSKVFASQDIRDALEPKEPG
jgi:hypothetical protein